MHSCCHGFCRDWLWRKEGVEPAGSNVLTFCVVKDTQPRELLEKKIEFLGGKKADISEVHLTATPEICYYYVQGGTSGESGLTTTQIFYAIPYGRDTILADGFRTTGTDEGTEASIDADFEYIIPLYIAGIEYSKPPPTQS